MDTMRPFTRIRRPIQWAVAVALFTAAVGVSAQESTQKLFESGNWAAVAERAGSGSPEDIYLAALAHMKAENGGAATNEMNRLREQGPDEAWKQIGASGAAMLAQNHGDAIDAARRATAAAGDNPYAQYQLGLAASGADDFATAAQAFDRATEIKADFAYAHYYAGQAHQKQRNVARATEHYQQFLQLAPDSPDRPAVQALLRALRK